MHFSSFSMKQDNIVQPVQFPFITGRAGDGGLSFRTIFWVIRA
ncbi:hypothetical protein SXCC_03536 [Gluconacetobacter sp. SXCC-1]|nr:hypothetical protein SXCC_03536 [Gluconacetobacter sp. SXCC-1]